jgi:hypothetical protein
MRSAALRHAIAFGAAALLLRGVALFSYDGLIDAAKGPGFLLQVARVAFNP